MLELFKLIPPLQVIFTSEHEFTDESFRELSPEQYAAYHRDFGKSDERVFQTLPIESTVIKRTPEKITWQLSVVTEAEKKLMLEAVQFVYRASAEMPNKKPTFEQRLAYLRPRLPPIVTQKPDS